MCSRLFFFSIFYHVLTIHTLFLTWKCAQHGSRGQSRGCRHTSRSWSSAQGSLLPRCRSQSRRCLAAQRTERNLGIWDLWEWFCLTSLSMEKSPPAMVGLWAGSQVWVRLFRSCSGKECQLNWIIVALVRIVWELNASWTWEASSSLLCQCIEELRLMGMMEQDDCGGGLVDGCNGYDFATMHVTIGMLKMMLMMERTGTMTWLVKTWRFQSKPPTAK